MLGTLGSPSVNVNARITVFNGSVLPHVSLTFCSEPSIMKPSLTGRLLLHYWCGFVVWRNGRSSRNILIPTPDFPHGYYAEGPHDGRCTIIRDAPSNDMKYCEDATFWEKVDGSGAVLDKVLLLSCDPNRKAWNTVMGPLRDPSPRGALWLYATGARRPQRITLEGYPKAHDFHPLGLDVSPSRPDEPYSNLFVVNHARDSSTIEQFALAWHAPDRARWVRTLAGPELVAPNALALTGPTSFYLTHDHRFTRRLPGALGTILPLAESLLALPLAWATHVLFYARDAATQALSLRARVPTPFAPDNVAFDARGALLVAGHPYFQALVAVAANDTGAHAPSWVVSITPSPPGEADADPEQGQDQGVWDVGAPVPASRKVPRVPGYELRTLYQSDGSEFASSSTALRDTKTGVLYVVGLYEEGLMVCTP
ncbi:hypothetical protein BC826DRAFT_1013908 [Russula brevipes]|nr:hypothetical protein BC826DRAFT_1013908 [Russula brevipes]